MITDGELRLMVDKAEIISPRSAAKVVDFLARPASDDPPRDSRPPVLPERFWLARPFLDAVRQFARASDAAPDAVLLQAIVRATAVAPTEAKIQTSDSGEPSSLSLFGICIGPSGAGKSSSTRVARRLVPDYGALLSEALLDMPIGSGEGMAEAYMDVDPASLDTKKPRRVQVRHRAHFHVDEAEALNRLVKRDGATLGETLRRAFTGETLGQKNAIVETTRIVRNYVLALTVNATPGVIAGLLPYAELGLPQRFLWASALDPDAPRQPPRATPPILPIAAPDVIRFDRSIQDAIREERWRARRGESQIDELDSHLTLIRCRVAAVLAAWGGRATVTPDDWALAGILADTSRSVRSWTIAAADEQRAEIEAADAERRGRCAQTVRAMTATADLGVQMMAQRIARRVLRAGIATVRDLNRSCTKPKDRHLLQAAIDHAEAAGWILAAGDDGYHPGPSRPAA